MVLMKFKSDASAQVIRDAKTHLLSLQSKVYTPVHTDTHKWTEGEKVRRGARASETESERGREAV